MPFATDIPYIEAYVKKEFLYDLTKGHGEVVPAIIFGVDSVEGQAIGFDVLLETGAMFARLPIHALCWKPHSPPRPLQELEVWDCFSYSVEAHEYISLRMLRVEVFLRSKEWISGTYLFTLSWLQGPLAEQPGQTGFKRAHIIKLDEGNFCAYPNNFIRWREPSFIVKPFEDRPDYLVNTHVWKAETESKWITSDDPRVFHDIQEGI